MRRCRRTSPAGQPDVDWDDPAQEPVDGVEGNAGDSVLIYGNAMMDTEHAQYFEIHPVGAYYVMARHGRNHETWNRKSVPDCGQQRIRGSRVLQVEAAIDSSSVRASKQRVYGSGCRCRCGFVAALEA